MSERLFDLLPVHVRARDEQSGGLLAELLSAVSGELGVLEADIDELYASWFIETCPDWVVPYIADLVGVDDLPPADTARAYVANTVAYRRRKGTLGVIEQVARDVTGWPAVAVESYRLLSASTALNHVRLDRPATAGVRQPVAAAGPLELGTTAQTALDRLPHCADMRSSARYGIDKVAVFLFDDQVCATGWCAARAPVDPADGWTVHPAGWDTPLYAAPAAEEAIETRAEEQNLPVPLRPRRLLAHLTAARGGVAGEAPVRVRVDGDEIDADRLRVCGLEDLDPGATGWQVMIDAVRGRLFPCFDGTPTTPGSVAVRYAYGTTADVGAGTHDRAEVHEDCLAADPYTGDPARGGPGVTAQTAVLSADTSVAAALADAEAAWTGSDSPAGGTYVISIGDSATYSGDLTVHIPAATRLVLVAATWPQRVLGPGEVLPPVPGVYAPVGVRPHLLGSVRISGDGGSSVILDGLFIDGDLEVTGALATISQSTVTGSVAVDRSPAASMVRSITGPVGFDPAAATLLVRDSIVDAAGAAAITGPGLTLDLDGTTVRGGIEVRALRATSSILDGPAAVENRQTGCVRFSFVAPGARVPRRYRCVPGPDDDPGLRPLYRAVDPGSPHYLTLAGPPPIAGGGEADSEMGVHHHRHRPARVRAAHRLLPGFVPVGIKIVVAAHVATGRS
jgi:Phage tail protein (Tail_P2_I)